MLDADPAEGATVLTETDEVDELDEVVGEDDLCAAPEVHPAEIPIASTGPSHPTRLPRRTPFPDM